MITDSELERLLEASSPYPREARDGLSMRAQADLQNLLAGETIASATGPRRLRVRTVTATAISVAAVSALVVGVPFLTMGVPTPEASTPTPVAPGPADEADAVGTFVSADGSTKGRVDVRVDGDSVSVEIVYLATNHDELIASGSLTSREDRACLDDGSDVEFGSFPTSEQRYTWRVEGNEMYADWTALHEIDLAVAAPSGEAAVCAVTTVARAVLDWSGAADSRAIEYATAIADWPEPLPPGYVWPAWSDLPHTELYGVGDFHEADNAAGIYRCILLDAAWHAYFEANDPVASKDYATRADQYAIAGNDATPTVTVDGRIVDEELARANGLCQGITGDASP